MDYTNASNLTSATATIEPDMDKYDKKGHLILTSEWARLMNDTNYTRVAKTKLGGYLFSTVWIGLGYDINESGPPLIFESMAFKINKDGSVNYRDIYQNHYSTLLRAKIGHYRMICIVLWKKFVASFFNK